MKTRSIISANIDSDLVKELKMKTKGTRSRIIERAIRAYLNAETDFSIGDVSTKLLATVLYSRLHTENGYKQTPLTMLLKELRDSLGDKE
tara:strand:- start:29 stop:298 length:270 start_codon:yes stop_codon:yes gene_type:complete